jgi:hypothetical protein
VETQVAVSPVDPRQIAVTDQGFIRVSTNNGGTFTNWTQFPNTFDGVTSTTPPTDPGLAYDSTGRLFWTNIVEFGGGPADAGVVITQIDPTTAQPVAGTQHIVFRGDVDKPFLAVDPTNNDLYVSWTMGGQAPGQVNQNNLSKIMISRSTDQGTTWSTPVRVDNGQDGVVFPSSLSVDNFHNVYVAYHSQTGFTAPAGGAIFSNPDGKSGQTVVVRYNFTNDPTGNPLRTVPFGPGQSDITFNFSQDPGDIPGTDFITVGSAQPWVLADPARPGNIYVIVNAGNPIVGKTPHVLIARSTDSGAHWTQSTVDSGAPVGGTGPLSFQLFPTAAIDQQGNLVVDWYDNRRNLGSASHPGNFDLDVYATYSSDGGQTWAPDFQVNDPSNPFDPDAGAVEDGLFRGNRIGEYFGLTVSNGTAYVAPNGNNFTASSAGPVRFGQQVYFNTFPIVSGSLTVNSTSFTTNILIRSEQGNPNFVQVFDNAVLEYTGLWSGLTSITVNADDGVHVDIENSVAGTQMIVNAASLFPTTPVVVDVSQLKQDLGNIQSPLTLNSTFGFNQVVFHDNKNQSFTTNYSLEGTPANPILRRDLAALISYSGFSKVEIDALRLLGGTATDHFNILTTPQFCTTTINGSVLGSDQFFVHATVGALIINTGLGSNSIGIGNTSGTTSTINTIQGPVTVNSSSASDTVRVGDQSNPFDANRMYTLTANTLTRNASPVFVPPITFNGVANRFFNLSGGITVDATPAGTNTTIVAPSVTLGQGNALQAIQGTVKIDNASFNAPPATVQLNDSQDTQSQMVTIGPGGITLPLAPINITPGSVGSLGYTGGVSSGGSTYTISGPTGTPQVVLTAPGPDTVDVEAIAAGTTDTILGQVGANKIVNVGSTLDASSTLDTIQGELRVAGSAGSIKRLSVNDQGAPPRGAQAVKITQAGFTRTGPNSPTTAIVFASGVQNEVFNVTGATTVEGTASGTSTTIDVFGSPTAGSPTVTLGQIDLNGNGTLQNIQGPVTFLSTLPAGTPSNPNLLPDVVLNDFSDTSFHNAFILPTAIINLAPFPIFLSAASVRVVEMAGPILPVGSTYTIEGTPAAELLQLAAFGPDTVNVQAVAPGILGFPTTTAILAGSGGGHIFNVGSNPTNPQLSTLDGIQGVLDIFSSNATDSPDTLNILDKGSTTAHTYNLTQNPPTDTFTRSAPNPVTINFSSIIHLNPPQEGTLVGPGAQAAALAFPSTVAAGSFATMSGRLVGTGELSLSIDWGDGTPVAHSTPDLRPFSVKHKYAQPGTYHVRAVWTDSSGQSGFREMTMVVTAADEGNDN